MPSITSLFKNNATTTLTASLASGSTSMSVGSSTPFPVPAAPTSWFYSTIIRASDSAIEIVKVTAISGTTWTITRAQEGTTALNFVIGDKVELRLTAKGIDDSLFGRLLAVRKWTRTTTESLDCLTNTKSSGAFTNGSTYTPLYPGATLARVVIIGGGGGGGSTPATGGGQYTVGQAGAGGACKEVWVPISAITGLALTVGAGGAGGTAPSGAGILGGTSSFGSALTAPGGTGGSAGTITTATVSFKIPAGFGSLGAEPASAIRIRRFPRQFGTATLYGGGASVEAAYDAPDDAEFESAGRGGAYNVVGASQPASNGIAGFDGEVYVWEYA